jgi:hypothetical protein
VFAKPISSSSPALFLSRIPVPPPLSSKSHGIISFADPHHLTSIESYRSKNIAGALLRSRAPRFAERGHSWHSNPPTCPIPRQTSPFPSCTYKMLPAQPLSFDNDPFSWGGMVCSQHSNLQNCQHSNPPSVYPLSFQILAHSFALFCARAKLNPFLFKRFRTLCQKPPGVGVPPLRLRQSPVTIHRPAPTLSGSLPPRRHQCYHSEET